MRVRQKAMYRYFKHSDGVGISCRGFGNLRLYSGGCDEAADDDRALP